MNAATFLESLDWRDLVDVLAVAIVFYNLLRFIRGTRAVQILLGILFILVVRFFAGILNFLTLKATLDAFVGSLPVVIVILFQNQIRQALTNFARNPLLSFTPQKQLEPVVNEIVVAASALSGERTGALMVVERVEGLREYVENGTPLDAILSHNLLINIFNTATPLHDGAVIIQEDRVAGAACFLPLSLNPDLSKELGTRHRAALRITQETDAIAVVVSEETGTISLTVGGQMTRDLDSRSLRSALHKYLITDLDRPQERRAS